jgi:hypothetical protein
MVVALDYFSIYLFPYLLWHVQSIFASTVCGEHSGGESLYGTGVALLGCAYK